MRGAHRLARALGLTLFLTCPSAWAALGAAPGALRLDDQPLNGPIRTISGPGYTVQELTTSEIVIREYVSQDGKVFAVSWSGRRSPDLPALFGAYFDQYQAASASRDRKRSPLRGVTRIETADLVVETGGHMGAIWGKAYLHSQLPPGVTKGAIR